MASMNNHIGNLIEYTEMILTDLRGMTAVFESMKTELKSMQGECPMTIDVNEFLSGVRNVMEPSGSKTTKGD